jgi:hypothetical protein
MLNLTMHAPIPPHSHNSDSVYIIHVGQTDKPIWPLYICIENQSSCSELKLKNSLLPYTKIIGMSEKDIMDIKRIIASLASHNSNYGGERLRSYGTFRIQLKGSFLHNDILLSPKQSVQVFKALYARAPFNQKILRDYLSNLLRRLANIK